MANFKLIALLPLITFVLAQENLNATDSNSPPSGPCKAPVKVTGAQLKTIAPGIATTDAECAATSYPKECATAEIAANGINAAFVKYNVMDVGVAAGSIANMVSETGAFAMNHNHFNSECQNCAGTQGQGTYAMTPFPTNIQYAIANNVTASTINPAWTTCAPGACTGTPEQYEALLALLQIPEHSYAVSAWYMLEGGKIINPSTCPASVLTDLKAGSVASYKGCLGTTASIETFFATAMKTLTCEKGAGGNSTGNSTDISNSSSSSIETGAHSNSEHSTKSESSEQTAAHTGTETKRPSSSESTAPSSSSPAPSSSWGNKASADLGLGLVALLLVKLIA